MGPTTVSVAEGKKSFSRLIQDALERNDEFIVTKRGKPVAAIVSYEDYLRSRRKEGLRKIMEARAEFLKSGVSAGEAYRESKKQIEKRK
jgi:prevent-host-death family protein